MVVPVSVLLGAGFCTVLPALCGTSSERALLLSRCVLTFLRSPSCVLGVRVRGHEIVVGKQLPVLRSSFSAFPRNWVILSLGTGALAVGGSCKVRETRFEFVVSISLNSISL